MYRIESYESNTSGVSATSSEVFAIQTSKVAFEGATSVKDIQELTITFLRGESQATAYHFGPLMAESAPIANSLIAMNRLGFITTGSQPGEIARYEGRLLQKRAYVEGILPRKYYPQFVQELYSRMGKSCFLTPLECERTYEDIQELEAADVYWVSRHIGQVRGILHIPEVTGPCEMFQTCEDVYPQLVDEYISLFIMDTRWGHPAEDLFRTILDILKLLEERTIQNARTNKFP
jgi:hypothetical protein